MEKFSEKSLLSLGDFYVYGLVDPRTNKIFYIGKGTGNRVFNHEKESLNSPDSDKLKLKTISEIKKEGLAVKKIIIHHNLSESEAYAAETALINVFHYVNDAALTNIAAGHHFSEVMSVEEYEKTYGAEELVESDIRHKILVIKVNRFYHKKIVPNELYDVVRGVWRASLSRVKEVEYVFGVFNSLIVAVYKPTEWYRCKDDNGKRPSQDSVLTDKTKNRIFFVDEGFEHGVEMDENQAFYCGKSIAKLKVNQSAQNPITYLYPKTQENVANDSREYGSLTKYIVIFSNNSFVKETNIYSRIEYSQDVEKFMKDVEEYCGGCEIYRGYISLLKENNIQWHFHSMVNADIELLSAQTICALILGAVRIERFSEGAILKFLKNGSILKWLSKLKEYDEKQF